MAMPNMVGMRAIKAANPRKRDKKTRQGAGVVLVEAVELMVYVLCICTIFVRLLKCLFVQYTNKDGRQQDFSLDYTE